MSTITLTTAEELLALPMGMGNRYELVEGELRVMPAAGWRHGQIVSTVNSLLGSYIDAHGLGWGFAAETGFRIGRNPDTVRAPDFAFIAKEHLPAKEPSEAFWPGAPDLAVEVLSPDDRTGEVNEKINAWFNAGCAAVWVVDPELETVMIFHSRTDVLVKTAGEMLTGDPVIPGFSCPVDELFR